MEQTQTVPPLSLICPRCGVRSFNPEHVQRRFCSYCKQFLPDSVARPRGERKR